MNFSRIYEKKSKKNGISEFFYKIEELEILQKIGGIEKI